MSKLLEATIMAIATLTILLAIIVGVPFLSYASFLLFGPVGLLLIVVTILFLSLTASAYSFLTKHEKGDKDGIQK
jgi:hypothetical protein